MKTFLDCFAADTEFSPREFNLLSEVSSAQELAKLAAVRANPALTMALRCETALKTIADIASGDFSYPQCMLEATVWFAAIAPFFLPTETAPLAIAAEPELVREFRHAPISGEVREFALASLARRQTFYVDLPERSMLLGRGSLQVRAIVGCMINGHLHVCAVMTEPGRNFSRRLHWVSGVDGVLSDSFHDPALAKTARLAGVPITPKPPLLEILAADGVDVATLRSSVENFVFLTVTHTRTVMEREPAAWDQLPFMAAEDPRRMGRRGKANAKKFSLFRVLRVTARGLRRTAVDDGSATSGQTLNHRSRVVGHYRLQAFGPKWSQRRLTWIAEHMRGPADAPLVTPIVKLTHADIDAATVGRPRVDAPPIFDELAGTDEPVR